MIRNRFVSVLFLALGVKNKDTQTNLWNNWYLTNLYKTWIGDALRWKHYVKAYSVKDILITTFCN